MRGNDRHLKTAATGLRIAALVQTKKTRGPPRRGIAVSFPISGLENSDTNTNWAPRCTRVWYI